MSSTLPKRDPAGAGASLSDLQWVSAAYSLVLAVLLLAAATLGDRLGCRRLILVGLVIFPVGAGCGPRRAN